MQGNLKQTMITFPRDIQPLLQFEVSCVTEAEAEMRRVQRREYPDNALEHPKRVAEIPTNRILDSKPTWKSSTQVGV